jgi:hypothetical protein
MKYLIALLGVILLFSFLIRSTRVRRGLNVVLVVLVAYAILKMTGVIEAIAPNRNGVF